MWSVCSLHPPSCPSCYLLYARCPEPALSLCATLQASLDDIDASHARRSCSSSVIEAARQIVCRTRHRLRRRLRRRFGRRKKTNALIFILFRWSILGTVEKTAEKNRYVSGIPPQPCAWRPSSLSMDQYGWIIMARCTQGSLQTDSEHPREEQRPRGDRPAGESDRRKPAGGRRRREDAQARRHVRRDAPEKVSLAGHQ